MKRELKFRAWDDEKMYVPAFITGDGIVYDSGRQLEDGRSNDHAIIMQFTGVKDKNGKEIYEGDICWTYELGVGNLKRVVVFDRGSFCIRHDYGLIEELRGWNKDYIEVLGNIHQNPELL